MPVHPVEFRVLGPFELQISDEPVRQLAAKPQTLLALLLLKANSSVESDWLIDQLWAGEPPAQAATTLRSYAYQLRRRLDRGDVAIRGRKGGYTLEVPDGVVDADRFEDLASRGRRALQDGDLAAAAGAYREGLAPWRGAAFAGLEVAAIRSRARALDELRFAVLEECIGAELESGTGSGAIAELESLVTEHPLREGPWRLLMLSLYRAGRQGEALETYRRLHRILDEELGVRPSAPVEELHRLILAGDPVPARVPPQGSATPAARRGPAPLTPRQLPAVAPYFTGRTAQVVELDRLPPAAGAPEHQATTVAVITGTAGVGKTALAVAWAHRVADRFPDGQLYANLRGFDPAGRPTAPTDVLRDFLDALGTPPASVPPGLDARAALYRSLLVGKRVLVVLDNAYGLDQIRPLLPGSAGCRVLVTSRNRLTGLVAHGAQPMHLQELDTAESRALLEARIPKLRTAAEPDATRRIIDACAGLPLALAIAAARAADEPRFPLAALAAGLGDAGGRLDALADPDQSTDIRAVFSWSYRALTADAARLFRLLGLHPGPEWPTAAAASIAGASPRDTAKLLTELTRANLLVEPAPGRYAFHDLLRTYAAELAENEDPHEDRAEAVRRLLDFYLHSAYAAHRSIASARDPLSLAPAASGVSPVRVHDALSARAWFAAEGSTLVATVDYAARWGFDVHCWQLAWTLRDYFDRGRYHELANVLRTGLEAAQRLGDVRSTARLSCILAQTSTHLGRVDEARSLVDQALALYLDLDDPAGEAAAQHVDARLWMRQGGTAEAIESGRRALDLYRSAGHRVGEAHVLNSIGWWHFVEGDHQQALHYCEQALPLMTQMGDRLGQADTADSLGDAHHHLGHYAEAIDHFQHAIGIYRGLGERRGEAVTSAKLGDTHHATGDLGAARRSWQQALDNYVALNDADAAQLRTKLAGLPSDDRRPPA